MAEFALGLTKTAVAGTVSRVKSAIEEEAQLRVRMQDDLVFISGEFEMMQAFLSAAGAGERASKNQVVRTWVRQLRDLAFDVEDCVELVLHLDNKTSRWDWVERLASSVLACMARPPPPLDAAVEEIKQLKARVDDVSQRYIRYNLITSGGGDGGSDNQQMLTQTAVSSASSSASAAAATFRVLRKVWKDMGKLHDMVSTSDLNKLIHRQGSELQVISLWGSPQADAIGWKAMVKKAYDDPFTCQEFKNRAWVKPTHPFNPLEFLNTLLTHFTSHLHHRRHHDDTSELVLQVRRHKYLIVLEQELSSVADWEAIRLCLPDGNNGSRIIVSTRLLGIALACTREPYQVWELRRFFGDQYLYVFFPKGSDQQDDRIRKKKNQQGHRGHGDQGDDIEEEDKFKPGNLVGREKERFDHVPNVPVMSFWGIAGVGKSALVREMYYGIKILFSKNYGTFGCVDVPHPFHLADLCRRLLLDFYSGEAKEAVAIAMMEGQDPTQWCSKILHESKFLLVLDGLQSKHDWDLIKKTMLSQPISGTIIVITREESIATHCTETKSHIHNIKGLDAREADALFSKMALGGRQQAFPDAEILGLVLSQCGGLPEIIIAIAGEFRDTGVLHLINDDFMGTLERRPGLRSLFCWMQSYFDACSDELKPCIFYLSVFPADQSIRRRRLLRRWIAEGYSSGGGGTTEEKGEKLWTELMKLSIIYKEETSTIKGCKVNGFFRAYIKSRPMEDNLVFALEGSCSPSSRLSGQHLSVGSSWDRDENLFNSIDLSRLRSLTVFGAWKSFLASENMKRLRVLDLEGTNPSDGTCVTDDDLEEIGKLLHRLKFLSLRGCQQITCLPDSLGDMSQLQTLDVRYTSIVELPSSIITKLHKLQYIRAGTSNDTSLILLQTKASPPSPLILVRDIEEENVEEEVEEDAYDVLSLFRELQVEEAASPPSPTPPPPPPQKDSHGGACPSLRDTATAAAAAAAASVAQLASTRITEAWKRKARDLVTSSHNKWWKLKNQMNLRRRCRVAANGGGVEIGHAAAEGIGRLKDMHTLGVVNVAGGKGALLFLKEMKNLTQLRKLGLSGIHRKNWHKFCDAISGNLRHLVSLSLQLMLLEEEGGSFGFGFACFHDILDPPKTLEHLKVMYTPTGGPGACIRPVWLKKLPMLQRLDHELTISSQEDIQWYQAQRPWHIASGEGLVATRVLIKPIEEHLSFEIYDRAKYCSGIRSLDSMRIECSSTLPQSKVTFGGLVNFDVKAISIHCCCCLLAGTSAGSCNLKIARLDQLRSIKEITVTGTYADGLKRDLREQINKHQRYWHVSMS